jgi:hypothetical protein
MAATRIRIWSEGAEDTETGLEIAGIQISYAELVEIRDRETALDMGVTRDLLEMWEHEGGRDYRLLVDWLYEHEAEQHRVEAERYAR